MKTLIRSLFAGLLVTANLTGAAMADTPKDIVTKGLEALFVNFDPAAAKTYLAEDYIQHNPAVPTGRAPILGFLPALKESGLSADVHRIIAEDDLVVVHSTYKNAQAFGADTLVAFDVFRVEDGKIAEHWDNLTPLADPNPSGRSQTDGPTEITDLEKAADNKALVARFIDTILVKGDMSQLAGFFDGDNYIQHNSMVRDGLSGLGTALKAMAEQGIFMKYDKVHKVVAEGNFVFAMSEGTFADKPTAYFDLFRVENGKIAEHWDVMADIPSEMAHDNGKF